jgi:hypothetical protein
VEDEVPQDLVMQTEISTVTPSFVEFQSISTHGAKDSHSFNIGGELFLAVANYYTGSNPVSSDGFNIDSKIYKWKGTRFVEFQSIPTSGACDWHSFEIGG